MTKITETTAIPNWLMTLVVGSLLTVFVAGWSSVSKLKVSVAKNEHSIETTNNMFNRILDKLDAIDERLREVE